MSGKITETRFTIQFNRTNPSHIKVAEILNRQGQRGKAQYIVNAVLHYENCGEMPNMLNTLELDIKVIETVVNRILRDKEENGATKSNDGVPYAKMKKNVPDVDEISYDDALEALGKNGFNAVAGTIDMFRKK